MDIIRVTVKPTASFVEDIVNLRESLFIEDFNWWSIKSLMLFVVNRGHQVKENRIDLMIIKCNTCSVCSNTHCITRYVPIFKVVATLVILFFFVFFSFSFSS